MSKKKYTGRDSKVELFHEALESLEEVFNHLEGAEVRYNELEHADYVNLVARPFKELIDSITTFQTNLDNGDYEPEINFEDFED
jgi:hypothetical protein